MAVLGDTVTLECAVEAQPEPKMLFWKDAAGWMPVIQGGQYNININKVRDVSALAGRVRVRQRLSTQESGPHLGSRRKTLGSR